MKKSIILIASIFLMQTIAFAQHSDPTENQINELKEKLNLTNQQVDDLRLILNNAREQEKEQWKLNKGDERAMRAAAKERNELTDHQIENILTAEQKTKYQKLREKEPKHSDPQLMELIHRLNLSDEQAAKVETILDNARTAREDMESSSGDRREMFENMHQMREQTDKEIEKVLTDEQKEEFKKFRAEREQEMEKMRGRRPEPGKMR
jgi:Spy/CpxP family protein refolding chaperone